VKLNKPVKALILVLVFVSSYLLWPDFRYEATCGPGSDMEGCQVQHEYDYSNIKLAGGWRSFWIHNCIVDGTVNLASEGICPNPYYDDPESRGVKLGSIGPLVVTGFVGVLLFAKLPTKRTTK